MPLGMMQSNAEMRSVATISRQSPRSKMSRTLPLLTFLIPGKSMLSNGSANTGLERTLNFLFAVRIGLLRFQTRRASILTPRGAVKITLAVLNQAGTPQFLARRMAAAAGTGSRPFAPNQNSRAGHLALPETALRPITLRGCILCESRESTRTKTGHSTDKLATWNPEPGASSSAHEFSGDGRRGLHRLSRLRAAVARWPRGLGPR